VQPGVGEVAGAEGRGRRGQVPPTQLAERRAWLLAEVETVVVGIGGRVSRVAFDRCRVRPCGRTTFCDLAEVKRDVSMQDRQVSRGGRACGVEPPFEHDPGDGVIPRGSNDLEANFLEFW